MAIFDFENVFGEDYLHFYGPDLSTERNAQEADAIWQMLSLQPGETVLDIGCGHGRIANELATRGARVTGLDADARFLEQARADARRRRASRSNTSRLICAPCPSGIASTPL